MSSIVCTLFENHFHKGLACLANSLHYQGFRGAIYAGYRGDIPPWAGTLHENKSLNWPGASTYEVVKGLDIHFLPLNTAYHFTNYKPAFMLDLFAGPAKDTDGIMYFDPDIVINCKWPFYENWITHGVALVHEIIVNDMPPSHPIRMEWKKIIGKNGMAVTRNITSYINGGFCGISKNNIGFLHAWKSFIKMGVSEFNADATKIFSHDKTHPFSFLDQDALNITAMCFDGPLSEIGPEGMDFIHGGWTMAHAVGSPKPWRKKYISSALRGTPPSIADKEFWKNVSGPVKIYSAGYIKRKILSVQAAGFIGRFYQRY